MTGSFKLLTPDTLLDHGFSHFVNGIFLSTSLSSSQLGQVRKKQ